jgi:hypothetical protein
MPVSTIARKLAAATDATTVDHRAAALTKARAAKTSQEGERRSLPAQAAAALLRSVSVQAGHVLRSRGSSLSGDLPVREGPTVGSPAGTTAAQVSGPVHSVA